AAESYGMEILAASIESDKQNFTRFLVLQNEGTKEQTANKASIHLILSHQVGSLAKVIKAVSNCGVNLVKIESMPILGAPWQYQFYLDVVYEHLDSFSEMTHQIKNYMESHSVLGHYHSNSDFQS
ncbi:MAG: prephenate dehydratase, partial [Flavobacteriales bacterium]|nr:prephenate dehydratase [Flavobacteriales bacterium]